MLSCAYLAKFLDIKTKKAITSLQCQNLSLCDLTSRSRDGDCEEFDTEVVVVYNDSCHYVHHDSEK